MSIFLKYNYAYKKMLQGWLVDNTVTTENKNDKILILKSAGNLTC